MIEVLEDIGTVLRPVNVNPLSTQDAKEMTIISIISLTARPSVEMLLVRYLISTISL